MAELASYYGPGLYGRTTKNGTILTPNTLGVAHRTLPMGTWVRLSYAGRSITVQVIDRGPAIWTGKTWDLTEAAALMLEPQMRIKGVIPVTSKVLKNVTFKPNPGHNPPIAAISNPLPGPDNSYSPAIPGPQPVFPPGGNLGGNKPLGVIGSGFGLTLSQVGYIAVFFLLVYLLAQYNTGAANFLLLLVFVGALVVQMPKIQENFSN